MIESSQVALVIPTRGDVPLGRILKPYQGLGFATGYVWNNGDDDEDLSVYGRYAAIEKTDAPVIVTQDDDVILPPETIEGLLDAYEPGKVVCNVPERFRERYTDSGLVGFGAIFDRDLPRQAFNAFFSAQGAYEDLDDGPTWRFWTDDGQHAVSQDRFRRTCDLVFTMLARMVQVDLPYTELAYAHDASRMWKRPRHFEERDRMRELCRRVRDGVAA